ncbi:MAG: hypothetical protein WCW35_05015 [Bacteroidota bacterium]|jgi:hypothetical protein
MNIFHTHYEYLKNEASLLLKIVQQSHASTLSAKTDVIDQNDSQENAVDRFRQLSSFATLTADDNNALNDLQLKHAFNVIAVENGYESWNDLKSALDNAAENSPLAEIKEQFYPKGFTTYWNIWFAKYSQAKKVLGEGRGYLLPFKNQYFIVEEHFVDSIGLPHTLREWKEIGNDWVHPKNVKAWLALNERYANVMKDR